MNAHRHVLAINGSYRDGGVTDRVLAEMADELRQHDVNVEVLNLREHPIGFCLNCRQCMQSPGDKPGTCVLDDGMQMIIDKIEAADAYVLASPTNFSSATALFKRFSERLAPFGYWPWGALAPLFRKDKAPTKPAILVSSCGAPGLLGRLSFMSLRELKIAARTFGARSRGSMLTGLVSRERHPELSPRTQRTARRLAQRLT